MLLKKYIIITTITTIYLGVQTAICQDSIQSSTDEYEVNISQYKWEICDLPNEELPSYDYFLNAGEGHYNPTLENEVAYVVKDYVLKTNTEEGEWELKRICYKEGIYHAYVESDSGNEMYILILDDVANIQPQYIITADIKKNNNGKILLQEEMYSYDSMVEWSSYANIFDGTVDMQEYISLNIEAALYDSIYENCGYYALYDYLEKTNRKLKSRWNIDYNMMYVGTNGYIADITFESGSEKINILIDVWNKTYAVLE